MRSRSARGIVPGMNQPGNVTNVVSKGGAEDLFARIAERAFEFINMGDPARRQPYGEAAVGIFDYVEALQREAKVRELRQRVDDACEFHDWLGEHLGREHRKNAAIRCRMFGLMLAQASDQTSLSFGMRLGAMAQQVAEGAADEKALKDFREVVFELSKALLEDYADLVKSIPKRPKDTWRAEEIAMVRANRGEKDEPELAEEAALEHIDVHPQNERTYRTLVFARDAREVPKALLLLADCVVYGRDEENYAVLKKPEGEIYWVGRCEEALVDAGVPAVDKVAKVLR